MNAIRPDIESLPDQMVGLPIFRGYGRYPEFRAMDVNKLFRAVNEKLCWVCGNKLGKFATFVMGPMCGINRNNAEPPNHLECARYSAKNCPFLAKPQMDRREGLEGTVPSGIGIMRNPGVTLLWTTRGYEVMKHNLGLLFTPGEPTSVEWWALSKKATRQQVLDSINSGMPFLEDIAKRQPGAMEELHRMRAAFEVHLPKE